MKQTILAFALGPGFSVLLTPSFARATNPLELVWQAPEGCSNGEEVRAEANREFASATAPKNPVVANVTIERHDGAWQVTLLMDVDGWKRRRTFQAESCEAAATSVAFILGLELRAAPVPVPAPSEPEPPPVAPLPPAEPVRPPVDVEATFAGVFGLLGSALYGPTMALGVKPGRFLAQVSAGYLIPQTISASGGGGSRFYVQPLHARFGYVFRFTGFDVSPYLGAGVEWIESEGVGGTAANYNTVSTVGTLFAGARGTLRLPPPFALVANLEWDAPLVRRTFVVAESTSASSPVVETGAFFGTASIGAEIEF